MGKDRLGGGESLWPRVTILSRISTPNIPVRRLGHTVCNLGVWLCVNRLSVYGGQTGKDGYSIVSQGPWVCGLLISCGHTSTSVFIKIGLARYGCA